jgi:alpha-L-rhamnosidase
MDRPAELRCEHLVEPLGIDAARPRFSWIPPRGGRGSIQSAWRIVCSRDRGKVEAGIGDLWDSGKMESEACHLVPYGGEELRGCTTYWWAVAAWNGEESAWSLPSSFATGVFGASSWKAAWISRAEPAFETSSVLLVEGSINSNRHVSAKLYHGIYLRKEFRLARRPSSALAFFCGLGCGELLVNGRKVGDRRLDPAQTDYREGALYSTYDITDSLLAGPNAFGVVLGNGRYLDAYGFGKPRAMLQVALEYEDGSAEILVSDGTWTVSSGPVLQNGIYSGEVYDARLEEAGWAKPNFPGCGWEPAVVVEGPELRSQTMPPIRATAELPARTLSNPEPGVFVFDFGQNFAGVARIRVSGPRGTRIDLAFAELLTPEGRLHLGTNRESQSRDSYILKGEGLEVWEPRFTYHGFRYAELRGYPGTPSIETLTGVVVGTDVPRTGAFSCSEGFVNAIHSNVLWGQRSNLMGAPTDCPQRGERMGWLGDAQLTCDEACCNFDMAAFYRKYLEDIRLAQKPDGSLSDVVPPFWPLYPADPAWSAAYPALAWAMYWNYNDVSALERHYEGVRRYVDFLEASSDKHILSTLGSYGDWCPPGTIYPKKTPMAFTSTWYLCHDSFLFARMAEVLGRKEDAAVYSARAAEIAGAFNEKFLLGEGRYATLSMSPIDRSVGQTTQALPLSLGIVPADQREAAVARLLDAVVMVADSHIDAGIVGVRYLFETLRDCGFSDVAWDVITQKSYPGWGYMVEEGATTLWERWEKLAGMGMNSHNHIMFGSVDAWFYRSLGGIVPLAAGWRRIRVAPKTPGSLSHASASQMTPRGRISVSWSRSPWLKGDGSARHASLCPGGGEFKLSLSIPDGAEVELEIPYADLGREFREGDALVWAGETEVEGVVAAPSRALCRASGSSRGRIERRGDIFAVELGSGDYEFALTW